MPGVQAFKLLITVFLFAELVFLGWAVYMAIIEYDLIPSEKIGIILVLPSAAAAIAALQFLLYGTLRLKSFEAT
jgi:hypothetical protein